MKKIKTIIIDDNENFLDAFTNYIENFSNMKIVGIGKNEEEALNLAKTLEPDLILLDIFLPDTNGFLISKKIRENSYEGKIILISAYDYFEYYDFALKSGADAFISKNQLSEKLHSFIQKLFNFKLIILN